MATHVRDSPAGANVNGLSANASIPDTSHRLVVISYNMHGFNQGRHSIIDLIATLEPDAIMVQEHWLSPDNLYKLSEIADEYFVFGSSAMHERISSGPLIGRPFGGTAIIINKKHIRNSVSLVSGDRFTAVKIANWLLITVYMPCVGTYQRDLLYSDTLSELDALISLHSTCSCLIGGDFNVQLDRIDNISVGVNNFNCNNQLHRCDVLFPVADRFTYFNDSLQCASTIDYFLTSNVSDTVGFNIVDLDINLSDHRPIMAICTYFDNPRKPMSIPLSNSSNLSSTLRLRWDHAPTNKYYAQTYLSLQPLLDEVNDLVDRSDEMDCQTVTNRADYIYERVVNVLRVSAHKLIPRRKGNFYKFWWSTELDILKDKAIESCRIWKNVGQPRFGPIHAQYKKR